MHFSIIPNSNLNLFCCLFIKKQKTILDKKNVCHHFVTRLFIAFIFVLKINEYIALSNTTHNKRAFIV